MYELLFFILISILLQSEEFLANFHSFSLLFYFLMHQYFLFRIISWLWRTQWKILILLWIFDSEYYFNWWNQLYTKSWNECVRSNKIFIFVKNFSLRSYLKSISSSIHWAWKSSYLLNCSEKYVRIIISFFIMIN